MANSSNARKRKGLISEDGVASLLKRYSATQVLAVLREVSQFPDVKIDWNVLVNKTSTGISNAREYQMLWRHLAYCGTLTEKVEEAKPLDDDSDLEYELEAFPPVSDEASMEAAACAKVLLASSLPKDSCTTNSSTIEAPLTINIPNGQAPNDASHNEQQSWSKGTNIVVPVSLPKQPISKVTTTEGLGASGTDTSALPLKRKRKPWTEEEDLELIAAVQKCGERNWANIVKGDFKGDRTPSQLSQRWSIIKKREGNLNPGLTGSQLSETLLATRHAFSLALDMPIDGMKASSTVGTKNTVSQVGTSALPTSLTEIAPVGTQSLEANGKTTISNSISPQNQKLPLPTSTSLPKKTPNTTSVKSRPITKKPPSIPPSIPVKPTTGPNPLIQATAVAAGARIAPPEAAKSFMKAAQSKNAFHIRPVGTLGKPPLPGVTKPFTPNHSAARSNVHYIRTGATPAAPSVSTNPPAVPSISTFPAVTTQAPAPAAEVKNRNATPIINVGNLSKEEKVKPVEEVNLDSSADVIKDCGQAVKDSEMAIEKQTTENPSSEVEVVADENDQVQVDNQIGS